MKYGLKKKTSQADRDKYWSEKRTNKAKTNKKKKGKKK